MWSGSEAIDLVAGSARDAGVTVAYEADTPLHVQGDRVRLRQVL